MAQTNTLAVVLEMLESAQASIRSARAMLAELSGAPLPAATAARRPLASADPAGGRIIEGVFDGQNMIGSDKRMYPVPPNYASKSKLVQGDILKLTITDEGSFIYKQIGPVPRHSTVGVVAFDEGQYKILAEGKSLRILMASVTFYKLEVGQRVTVLLPDGIDAEWATLDNILPPEQDAGDGASMPEEEAPQDAAPAAPKRRTKKAAAEE